jgi:hypothetical protein
MKILNWIKDEEFFHRAKNSIQLTVSKIHDHYFSYLRGGWSSNSNVWILITEYAELVGFLNSNYIIYDQFQEFESLSSIFFEGIFASHAMRDNNNSRLETFDDWLMKQLMVSLSAERIKKIFRRYKLKEIEYFKSTSDGDSFIEISHNFLNDPGTVSEEFLKCSEESNRRFVELYNRTFSNIVTLTFLCNFNYDYYNEFSEKLINYLENEQLLDSTSISHLISYLNNVGDKLQYKLLKRFFILGLKKKKYHGEEYFEALAEIIAKKGNGIEIDKTHFDLINNMILEDCTVCNTRHAFIEVIPLFRIIINNGFRNELKDLIIERLNRQFDFQLFYLASLYEIIEFDKQLLEIAIDEFNPTKNPNLPKFFLPERRGNRYARLGNTFNLCFKFDEEVNTKRFEKFKGLDLYYDWLIDMAGFDYSKFDPKWIGEYPTRYYYKKIACNNKVKQALVSYLKEKVDEKVEYVYINLYVRRKWEKNLNNN